MLQAFIHHTITATTGGHFAPCPRYDVSLAWHKTVLSSSLPALTIIYTIARKKTSPLTYIETASLLIGNGIVLYLISCWMF